MRYVIIRDDDTNALTPVECLERLYRPFLDRGFPVNLAVIPKVRTDVLQDDGRLEGYLLDTKGVSAKSLPIGSNQPLIRYLQENQGYHIAHHGYHHTRNEFDSSNAKDVRHRLKQGAELFAEAGFAPAKTFVAPYDKISRASYRQLAERFRVVSTGWFEARRLPYGWWPSYLRKKVRRAPHWRIGSTLLLSHPGCLLSYQHPYQEMLKAVQEAIRSEPLTVLVTHWWEYFRDHHPDEPFIEVLHQVAEFLDKPAEIKVVSFDDLTGGRIPISFY